MTHIATTIETVLTLAPVIPVVTIADLRHAVPLARALVEGGTPAIEVTLRTPTALDAIRLIAAEVPGAVVGAGTIIEPRQIGEALAAGARFLVSPGTTDELVREAVQSGAPLLPGAATASEAMRLLAAGFVFQKFFPAAAAGGAPALASLAAPLPQIRFCPTGGISAQDAPTYLRLKNVLCVGGSWLTPADAVAAGDWERVRSLARATAGLRPAV
ncbi:KHG/KDPG aldolase [Rhodovastum atsumiense]|uniref:Bifunctional 4-hydroxy-2-oxoglutarate aldolase/2-dehydro-3-deoxy-phosphogluconate aldolase n=1 Tax=Rhodovastum atsumiense TaxID=504468 RepID=A0A5M6J1C6_9PROT|nr:bifunctional 4-hydroxy-2-oxoglutarate aldolase/2-dehydro-3-deoxy-phosphogluconate aldolase [Rhodovastum atsumiense]KAA5614406.1 bifunctional 4-hydroxy-2-oxoglutarate aldolase/2-dehydro-3-deoxy-phosphogluconate aldolase [Rhodovastum atsumiense]CAH2604885.1 KHG/KDPG aldolase [Rhodovastum atsumiense]